jgi:hypothetical protein
MEMEKTMKTLVAILAVVLMASSMTSATTTTTFADPTVVTNVIGSTNSAPGFGPKSWQANAIVAGQKSEFYITPQILFGISGDVTIGQLSSISYWTNKATDHTAVPADWFIAIYTKPGESSLPVHGSWYGNRINSEPYFSQNLTETAGTWTQWVTGGPNNKLRFFDSTNNQYFGGYGDGFLSDITGNANYANQKILYISVQTGSAWAAGVTSLVDGLSVELTNGDIGQVNMVPEPATMALLGLGSLFFARKKK